MRRDPSFLSRPRNGVSSRQRWLFRDHGKKARKNADHADRVSHDDFGAYYAVERRYDPARGATVRRHADHRADESVFSAEAHVDQNERLRVAFSAFARKRRRIVRLDRFTRMYLYERLHSSGFKRV